MLTLVAAASNMNVMQSADPRPFRCGEVSLYNPHVHHQRRVNAAFRTYEGCSGSSWNLVIKFSFIDIILSFFEISQVNINELTSRS